MGSHIDWRAIDKAISAATGTVFRTERGQTLAGGDINEAVCLEGGGQRFFVKLNCPGRCAMFEAEAAGLEAIRASATLRAPAPVATGETDSHSFLVLEYIDFGTPGKRCSECLGERLAAMHRVSSESFGWHRDNTIGSTPQPNGPCGDWVAFFRERRLGFQLDLAAGNGAAAQTLDVGRRLLELLPALFATYRPQPSLLHGDLWGGNWAADESGQPVIYDPAVYFGDREADLAMTELFGGFDDRFYQSYRHAWTCDPGYRTRKVLYNLYHVLNHFNLFGGGYERQARGMIDGLIAEIS